MKNDFEFQKKWRLPLIVSFITLLIISISIIYLVFDYDYHEITVMDENPSSDVYLENDLKNPKGERWYSDIPKLNNPDETVLLVGETVNCSLVNVHSHDIKNWKVKLSPKNECYLNGFWGGILEVHQFRNGKELVETLEKIPSASEIENLETNPYCEAMMIRLKPGDYMIYSPLGEESNAKVKAKNSTAIVLNVYYLSSLDLSDYEVTYKNDLKVKNLWISKLVFLLWIIWFVFMLLYHTIIIVNKRILRDIKNKDQSIYVMADLYLETYRINLDTQEAYMIKGNHENPIIAFEKNMLQESLDNYIIRDCDEASKRSAKKFFDLATLEERLSDASSILFEYHSNTVGWCSIRFFRMSEVNSHAQYVLTIQDINEERQRLLLVEENAKQFENTMALQEDFMNNIFFAINNISDILLKSSEALVSELTDANNKSDAQIINYRIEHLHLLLNFVFDLFTLETNHFQLKSEVYSIHEMSKRLQEMLKPFYEEKAFTFQMDVDPKIPEKIVGDKEKLMQILSVLLVSAMYVTNEGYVKLSIFGKNLVDSEDLIFSVRDTGYGFSEKQLDDINNLLDSSLLQPYENASLVYLQIINLILKKMNSKINIVSIQGSGSEFYFSINQKIICEQETK